MAHWIANGKQLTDNEYEDYQRQQLEEQERIRQRTEALIQKLGQTYDELTRLLAQSPEAGRQVTGETTKDKEVYLRLKRGLELANMAPRCRWVKQGGTSCGSPQMKKHIYCFAHMQMMEARELMLRLPPPEDANAIQIGLMRIQKSLIEDTISTKKAGLLLYSMQLALTNVGQTTFGQAKEEEMVRDTVDEMEAFSDQQSAISEEQNQRQNQEQNLFTTKDAEDAKEEEGLPLRNTDDTDRKSLPLIHGKPGQALGKPGRVDADERGLERGGVKPVEWRPTPDMYRTDTPEGRAAYEACFRLKVAEQLGGERQPVQAVIAPEERAECAAPQK